MTADKFVFREENLQLCRLSSGLVKPVHESQWIGKSGERDLGKRRAYRLGGRVSEANAEIQPGSYFSRLDVLGDIDYVDSDRMGDFFLMIAYLQRRRHVMRHYPCQNPAA